MRVKKKKLYCDPKTEKKAHNASVITSGFKGHHCRKLGGSWTGKKKQLQHKSKKQSKEKVRWNRSTGEENQQRGEQGQGV